MKNKLEHNSEENWQEIATEKRTRRSRLILFSILGVPIVIVMSIMIYFNSFRDIFLDSSLCIKVSYDDYYEKTTYYCYEDITEQECLGECDGDFLQYKYLYNIGNCNYLCNGIGQDYYNSACRERNNQF